MAILVGVMAPQLIKYIEKSNVSSDTQLCDSVRTALTTAMMDPAVINDPNYTEPQNGVYRLTSLITGQNHFSNTDPLSRAVLDTLGANNASAVVAQLKSTTHNNDKASILAVGITVEIINNNNIIVYVPDGCGNGQKGSCTGCNGLYAGATAPTNIANAGT